MGAAPRRFALPKKQAATPIKIASPPKKLSKQEFILKKKALEKQYTVKGLKSQRSLVSEERKPSVNNISLAKPIEEDEILGSDSPR